MQEIAKSSLRKVYFMSYLGPVDEMIFLLRKVFNIDILYQYDQFAHLDQDTINSILREASKMSENVMAPLNRISDKNPAVLENGSVVCSPGFIEAYKEIAQGGWIATSASSDFGGMGLPLCITTCVNEMMNSACISLALNPLMTQGQIEALDKHACQDIKEKYLPKLISGDWSGTMNLTEPQAGSDVGSLRTVARELNDGTFEISGQKIYISWGDHNLTENICHLVLARLPDGLPGSKGISLFIVPKFLADKNNNYTIKNGVNVISLEKKMGLNGSPTATINYENAKGWIVGEPHQGLNAMFTMMNNARLGVGVQGLSQSEVAFQKALNYAKTRKQGKSINDKPLGSIIDHADVRRNLMIMRCLTDVSRSICLDTAISLDLWDTTNKTFWRKKAEFLTPIAKAFSTDSGCDVASLGMQIHGGLGYIEDVGASQFYRDVRITSIYEGTNGIQAIDLVSRKLGSDGCSAKILIDEIKKTETECEISGRIESYLVNELRLARVNLTHAVDWMVEQKQINNRLAGATPFLKAFALVLGAHYLLKAALACEEDSRLTIARFFVQNLLPESYSSIKTCCNVSDLLYEMEF